MVHPLFRHSPARPWIKICGVTRLEDAQWLAGMEIDAIGLNFHPTSPRFVDEETARAIVDVLPKQLPAIGVFVDRTPAEVRRIAESVGLAGVQLHGSEPTEYLVHLAPHRTLKAFRVRDASTLKEIEEYLLQSKSHDSLQGILLDAFRPGQAGGTGEAWDWSTLDNWKPSLPWLLAGGITPTNVEDAIRRCRPAGVDLASGVESSPGIKDRGKVEALIAAVKRAGC